MRKLVWVIPLLLLAGGISLGALVNYLSNTITLTTKVESPLHLHDRAVIKNGTVLQDPVTIYGGDTIDITYKVDNRANNAVDGVHRLIITPLEGSELTGEEIDDVTFTYGDAEYQMCTETQTGDCVNITAADGVITIYSPVITHEAGSEVDTKFTITWDPATEPGTYRFEAQVIVPTE